MKHALAIHACAHAPSRATSPRRSAGMRLLIVVTIVLATLVGGTTHADAQDTEKVDIAVFVTPEISTMRLFGANQELTSWSIGGHLRQGLAVGPATFSLRIGGDAFLTYQEGPPFQRGLRTFSTNFAVGARANLGVFRVGGTGEYGIVNVAGNPLDQTLGDASRFHLVGGSAIVAFTGMAPILAEVRVTGWHWFNTTAPTNAIQITFSIGLEAIFRR